MKLLRPLTLTVELDPISIKTSMLRYGSFNSHTLTQTHIHRHTDRTDCFTWITGLVGNSTKTAMSAVKVVYAILRLLKFYL